MDPKATTWALLGLALVAGPGCYLRHSPPNERRGASAPPPRGAVAIASGHANTCAAMADGSVLCWGHGNVAGATPEAALGVHDAVDLGAGGRDACALSAAGVVTCSDAPGRSPGLEGALEVDGGATQVCGRFADGTVSCGLWGGEPSPVHGITDVAAVAVGKDHVCVVDDERRVRCWGGNVFGQIGDGTTRASARPERVSDLRAIADIAAGGEHTCALHADGRVSCWGRNGENQLGDGDLDHGRECGVAPEEPADCSLTPRRVQGLNDAVAVSAGFFHTCAVRAGGTVVCWGSNAFGRLGDGEVDHGLTCGDADCTPTPVAVVGLEDTLDIAAGQLHTCALGGSGAVHCWGANFLGQLGDGSYRHHEIPGLVPLP